MLVLFTFSDYWWHYSTVQFLYFVLFREVRCANEAQAHLATGKIAISTDRISYDMNVVLGGTISVCLQHRVPVWCKSCLTNLRLCGFSVLTSF